MPDAGGCPLFINAEAYSTTENPTNTRVPLNKVNQYFIAFGLILLKFKQNPLNTLEDST
jgi:hypothetical protein